MADQSRKPGGKQKLTIGGIVVALIGLALANPTIRAKLGLPAQTQQQSTQQTQTASNTSKPQPDPAPSTSSQPTTTKAQKSEPKQTPTTTATQSAQSIREASAAKVREAYENGTSDLQMEITGRVRKTLPDDNEGSRHQRFILQLSDGNTVLIAHNIDLADRVPVKEGDEVVIYGEYEWSEQGGTMHWTHHDPKGWHEDGWIMHNGKTYK
ncbi:MAG: DUF3465 domain-containing protein [Phycisphaeraceae bacterium]|nr:DUF3465 domain-containing protein [Phycisphaerales bacterium]MCB9861684.1 DUF3465 domain-containing protein [Phycisphaeraceae bacterium]